MKTLESAFKLVLLSLLLLFNHLGTESKFNVRKMFRIHPRRLLDVLCTFSLRPVPRGSIHQRRNQNPVKYHSKFSVTLSTRVRRQCYGIWLSHIFEIPCISNEKPSISIEIPSISIKSFGFRSKY